MESSFRRLILIGLAAALLSGCPGEPAGRGGDSGRTAPEAPAAPAAPLVLAVNDPFCEQTHSGCVAEGRTRQYVGLAGLLSAKIGRPVELRYCNIEPQVIDVAGAGKIDGVICKPWTAEQAARSAGRKLDRLADFSMVGDDAPDLLEAVFFVRQDSSVRSLSDLAGRRLGVGGADSYEKSRAVRERLAEAGVPLDAISATVIPTCLASAVAVMDRDVDAAVMSSYAFLFGTPQAVGLEGVREVGRTAPMPFITLAVFDTIPVAERALLREALLELTTTGGPADLGATRIMPARPWQVSVEPDGHERQ